MVGLLMAEHVPAELEIRNPEAEADLAIADDDRIRAYAEALQLLSIVAKSFHSTNQFADFRRINCRSCS